MKALRIALIILATVLFIAGLVGLVRYAKDYKILSNYGQGYVIGKAVLLVSSIGLFLLSKRLNKKTNTSTRNY